MSNTILSTRHAVKTSNQAMPAQFLAMAIPVNLVAGQTDSLDLTNAINTRQIDQVQCMFVDNASSLGALTIVFSASNQRIIIPAFSQAYVPVLSVNDPVLTFTASGLAVSATLQLLNMPMPLQIWPVLTPLNTSVGTSPVSRSIITAAATSAPLMTANPNRQYMMIKSPLTADVWINPIGGVASIGGLDCFQILMGPYFYESGSKCFTGLINYFCVTGALNLTALEG